MSVSEKEVPRATSARIRQGGFPTGTSWRAIGAVLGPLGGSWGSLGPVLNLIMELSRRILVIDRFEDRFGFKAVLD